MILPRIYLTWFKHHSDDYWETGYDENARLVYSYAGFITEVSFG